MDAPRPLTGHRWADDTGEWVCLACGQPSADAAPTCPHQPRERTKQ